MTKISRGVIQNYLKHHLQIVIVQHVHQPSHQILFLFEVLVICLLPLRDVQYYFVRLHL